MDKLEDAFEKLAAHIDAHAAEGPRNGIGELAKSLGMACEDLSDGGDIHEVYKMRSLGTLTLIYLLVPTGKDDPLDENYWLELSGRSTASHARVWHFRDGKLTDKPSVQKAA